MPHINRIRLVNVNYNDAKLNKIRLSNNSVATLSNLPEWFGETYNYMLETVHALFLSLPPILMPLMVYLLKI